MGGYQQFLPLNVPNAARAGVSDTPCGPACPTCAELVASCGSPNLGDGSSPLEALANWLAGCIASGKLSHRDSCNPGLPLCPMAMGQE
jgi:hypothetical protein